MPDFNPPIPLFNPVIPAKAGIQTANAVGFARERSMSTRPRGAAPFRNPSPNAQPFLGRLLIYAIPLRMLPRDLPPRQTVYAYF